MTASAQAIGSRVLVTGATGFIGGATTKRLRKLGVGVAGLCRTSNSTSHLREHGVELVFGELLEQDSLERACEGCDTVIHCAALVGPGHKQSEYRRVIVEGTRRMLAAARRRGVSRFVYLSSAAAYDKPRLFGASVEVVAEEAPIGGCGEPYGEAKAAAERLCRAAHDVGLLSVRILRPTNVYGPGDRGFLPFLVSALRRKKLALLGGGSGRCSVVHIDDVVDSIILAATAAAAHGRAYNVTGPDELTWRGFLERVVAELGVTRPRSVPWPAAYAAGAACEAAEKLGLLQSAPVSRALVRFLVARRVFSTERAASELDFRARVHLDSALHAALAVLKQ
jgi:nucleoside-diphosphate-sugar epimerase